MVSPALIFCVATRPLPFLFSKTRTSTRGVRWEMPRPSTSSDDGWGGALALSWGSAARALRTRFSLTVHSGNSTRRRACSFGIRENGFAYSPHAFAGTDTHPIGAADTQRPRAGRRDDSEIFIPDAYYPHSFAGADVHGAHALGAAADVQRPRTPSRAGAAAARTGDNGDARSIPADADEPIAAAEHYPHPIADHTYGFAGAQHDSGFAYNPHTLAGHTDDGADMLAVGTAWALRETRATPRTTRMHTHTTRVFSSPTRIARGPSRPRRVRNGRAVSRMRVQQQQRYGERTAKGRRVEGGRRDEAQYADARYAADEGVEYVDGVGRGRLRLDGGRRRRARRGRQIRRHGDASYYDEQDAQRFAGMCGVYAHTFEAGFAFGAEFGAVVEDALAPPELDGEGREREQEYGCALVSVVRAGSSGAGSAPALVSVEREPRRKRAARAMRSSEVKAIPVPVPIPPLVPTPTSALVDIPKFKLRRGVPFEGEAGTRTAASGLILDWLWTLGAGHTLGCLLILRLCEARDLLETRTWKCPSLRKQSWLTIRRSSCNSHTPNGNPWLEDAEAESSI
ncbi:hypothetical protein DFH09DRAFT_1070344 [Mycena vulgaris]|nr:hypothetical protein DFH09DRAFT_1070344 [Mycena vulgaris]